MSRVAVTLSVFGVLAAAACGADPSTPGASPDPDEITSTTQDLISADDLDVIVPPDDSGAFPDDLVVSCDGARFPIGALETIRPLSESDPEGLRDAIEPFLSSGEGEFWPQDEWQLLHMANDHAQLVAKTTDGTLAFMSVTKDGSGWSWSGSSMAGEECRLTFVVPDDLNTVEWRPDHHAPGLTADSTEVAVILNERECVGGIEIGDRLVGPQVVMTDTQVFIAFAAERPPGDAFTCQGNPDTAYLVELPEAIGDRELVEGMEIGITLDDYVD